MKKKMSFAKLLTRRRPKLMRKWREDAEAGYQIRVADDLDAPALVVVQLRFRDGRVEDVEIPVD